MITGHVGARQLEVVDRTTAYRETCLIEDNDAPALGIVDFEACVSNVGHGMRGL